MSLFITVPDSIQQINKVIFPRFPGRRKLSDGFDLENIETHEMCRLSNNYSQEDEINPDPEYSINSENKITKVSDFCNKLSQTKLMRVIGLCGLGSILFIVIPTMSMKIQNQSSSIDNVKETAFGVRLNLRNLNSNTNLAIVNPVYEKVSEDSKQVPLIIESVEDFNKYLGGKCTKKSSGGLEVISLISPSPYSSELETEYPQIHTWLKDRFEFDSIRPEKFLTVKGRISEDWLACLVKMLPSLNKIVINVDSLCKGASEIDRENLKTINLKNVESLTIEEAHLCPIITWILKWDAPQLKTLQLHGIEFSRKSFKALCNFLDKEYKYLEIIEIKDCTFSLWDENLIPERIRNKIKTM